LPGRLSFSAHHFRSYYQQFSLFYGALLLLKYGETFGAELRFSTEVAPLLGELRALLEGAGRWPELVTYETMNFKPSGVDHARHIAAAMIREEERRAQTRQPK
jgi:hypothetical protein